MDEMTVEDLIAELKQFDPEAKVRLAKPTNNYWHEIAADPVNEVVEGKMRVGDDQTTCPNKIIDEVDETGDDLETENVVILY